MSAAVIERLRGGLIVSCQALPGEPLHGSEIMARMALAAQLGGAAGIRANSPEDIAAIRAAVHLPIIGLYKVNEPGFDVYITPRLAHARAVFEAGADIVAVDATARPHPEALDGATYVRLLKATLPCPILADISTLEEGLAAAEAGADLISTTMSGYTPYSPQQDEPDLELVRALACRVDVPVIAEGRIHYPEQAAAALKAGAFAVVVGGAITRPQEITARFVRALQRTTDHGR
ncbi:MAG: N-acetylmannosamine-6-phosphate 2-epimerase [Anaerolineae bacterium]|nr:N-acetylmannosamine-6-phosphate 2-epimerase [Anaerolineae bacterium]MDW8101135.1 N-acetylmannosamine-6-phosphate 2-epimerase [Anaerolineae bacterium]